MILARGTRVHRRTLTPIISQFDAARCEREARLAGKCPSRGRQAESERRLQLDETKMTRVGHVSLVRQAKRGNRRVRERVDSVTIGEEERTCKEIAGHRYPLAIAVGER